MALTLIGASVGLEVAADGGNLPVAHNLQAVGATAREFAALRFKD